MAGFLARVFGRSNKKQDDTDFHPALIRAVREGALDKITDLVNRGADVDARDSLGFTVLHLAASVGDMATVAHLIKLGAEVNVTSLHNCTPLHWAALGGHTGIARKLVECGAAIGIRDARENETAVQWAMRTKHDHTARVIIESFSLMNARRVAAIHIGSKGPGNS